jgi:hypothetical protein
MGTSILLGLAMTVAAVLFAFGLIGDQKVLIAVGLLLIALIAIYGTQPNWPRRKVD